MLVSPEVYYKRQSYLMEGVPNWKLTSENQHTFNGPSEKIVYLKLSILENLTFTYALTQIIRDKIF